MSYLDVTLVTNPDSTPVAPGDVLNNTQGYRAILKAVVNKRCRATYTFSLSNGKEEKIVLLADVVLKVEHVRDYLMRKLAIGYHKGIKILLLIKLSYL